MSNIKKESTMQPEEHFYSEAALCTKQAHFSQDTPEAHSCMGEKNIRRDRPWLSGIMFKLDRLGHLGLGDVSADDMLPRDDFTETVALTEVVACQPTGWNFSKLHTFDSTRQSWERHKSELWPRSKRCRPASRSFFRKRVTEARSILRNAVQIHSTGSETILA
jgi:hypothetical protein